MIEVGQGPEISDADEAGTAAELGIGRWCCQRENVYEMKPAELMCSNICRETFQLLLRTELVSFQPHTAKLLCSLPSCGWRTTLIALLHGSVQRMIRVSIRSVVLITVNDTLILRLMTTYRSAFLAHSEIEVFQWLSTYQTLGTYYLGIVLYCESEVE